MTEHARTMTDKIDLRRQVCDLIYTADSDDLDVFFDAIKRRRKAIQEQNATAVMVGATVTTVNLSPKALSGLTGTVVSIQGKRATVEINEAGQRILRSTRHGYAAPMLNGVPLTALEVQR